MALLPQITQANLPEGMIDFGLGQPRADLLPRSLMQQAAAERLAQANPSLLAYGAEQGDGYFRQTLAQFLSHVYSVSVDPDHLLITNGASQALDFICTMLTQAGDTVFVEEPSYFLALRILADHRLKIVSIPIDQDGLIIEALEEKLAENRPVFLYTIPSFHNPAGVTLSPSRRQRLVELSEFYDFLIVADEVYQLLAYTVAPPPPLPAYDSRGRVFSLGSFSKILAPGLRLGWLQAQPARLHPFVNAGLLDSGGGFNPFTGAIVSTLIEQGWQQHHLTFLKNSYQQAVVALSQALRHYWPELNFVEPAGGFFIWGHLAEGVDTAAFLPKARSHQVGFQPGVKFSSCNSLQNYLRLSFAFYNEADLGEGARRLAEAYNA